MAFPKKTSVKLAHEKSQLKFEYSFNFLYLISLVYLLHFFYFISLYILNHCCRFFQIRRPGIFVLPLSHNHICVSKRENFRLLYLFLIGWCFSVIVMCPLNGIIHDTELRKASIGLKCIFPRGSQYFIWPSLLSLLFDSLTRTWWQKVEFETYLWGLRS